MKFETGKTYFTRSIGDHDCIHKFEILKRTDKSVWVRVHGEIVRRAIEIHGNTEAFYPFGKYSMAATITADSPLVEEPEPESSAEVCNVVEPYFVTAKSANLNKNSCVSEYIAQVEQDECTTERYKVCYEVTLDHKGWNHFVTTLMDCRDWMADKGGTSSAFDPGREISEIWELTEDEMRQWRQEAYNDNCILVSNGWSCIVIDPQGYNYARYVGVGVQREECRAKPARRHLSIVS
jgi:hypothetical protein